MQNIGKLMKQAQAMQKKMEEMQNELAKKEVEGQSGGGVVKVTVNGKGELQKLNIDEEMLNKDEKEMLEDLIVAAYNDAKAKADSEASDAMKGATGGLNIPGMPF